MKEVEESTRHKWINYFVHLDIPNNNPRPVARFTETKPKYRNETEIPKRTIKNIGKMLLVSKCWSGNG